MLFTFLISINDTTPPNSNNRCSHQFLQVHSWNILWSLGSSINLPKRSNGNISEESECETCQGAIIWQAINLLRNSRVQRMSRILLLIAKLFYSTITTTTRTFARTDGPEIGWGEGWGGIITLMVLACEFRQFVCRWMLWWAVTAMQFVIRGTPCSHNFCPLHNALPINTEAEQEQLVMTIRRTEQSKEAAKLHRNLWFRVTVFSSERILHWHWQDLKKLFFIKRIKATRTNAPNDDYGTSHLPVGPLNATFFGLLACLSVESSNGHWDALIANYLGGLLSDRHDRPAIEWTGRARKQK